MVLFLCTVFSEMAQEMDFSKFIRFTKVNAPLREVSGIVTAEQPDKELEVCDYEKSKPYYEALISEMSKATEGQNIMPLREMHQLSAVGKGIGFNFNDNEKEIEMTFKVVDDEAWKKVEERVYTGFSQGGRKVGNQVPDPVHKGCMRYVANPVEVSLVDNPCLPEARFAYVKADGQVEMRKFLKTEVPVDPRIVALEQEVSLLKAANAAPITAIPAPAVPEPPAVPAEESLTKATTKRVAGKDLPSSSFAYVGDPEKTETWKFPIHDKAHARNALARFNQAKGIPASEKGKVRAKIVAAAKKFGIDVSSENEKCKVILSAMRKAARMYVNRTTGIVDDNLADLDSNLGKALKAFKRAEEGDLRKGMWEVSRLACMLEDLSWMVFAVANEEEWEMDEESALPHMLAENVAAISETFVAMVDEETRELLEHVNNRVAH